MRCAESVLTTFLVSTWFFSIVGTNSASGAVDLTLSSASVGDRVDQSPNLPDGGFATAESRPRFQAVSARLDWSLDERTIIGISLAQRELNSLRDSFEINQFSLSGFTRISPVKAPYLVGLNLGLSINHADHLAKNSFTHYNGAVLQGASINKPQDLTLSAALSGVRPLSHGFAISGRLGAGLVSSSHDSMQGQGESSEGCQYAFSTNGSTGTLQQQGTCGVLVSYSQQFTNEDGVEDRLGFRSSQDVAYKARFLGAGGALNWSFRSVSVSVDYGFRKYFRDRIDRRISINGDTPTRFSQIVTAVIAYRPSQRWTVALASTYQSASYLDEIPLLYTAFTSERYTSGDSLSFQVSVTLHL